MCLQRKFEKNAQFKEEYTAFLENVINKGHAEAVTKNELEKDDGRLWYIPHHGVYHSKKGTIRVVFDCSASYQGLSLNSELIQGEGARFKLREPPYRKSARNTVGRRRRPF